MQVSDTFGLDHMPKIDLIIASFVLSPEEVLRTNGRCHHPQWQITDNLLIQAYNTAARMGHIGNSLSHLMLALSESLQASGSDTTSQDLSNASLQAVAFMTGELGRLMSTLTQTRWQVWLSQSPLSEVCRRTLRDLPVVPGQLFGPAAQQTLERCVQVNQTRPQIADLRSVPLSHLHFRLSPIGPVPHRSQFATRPTEVHRSQPQTGEQSHRIDWYVKRLRVRFSHQQLSYWETTTSDPWVIVTLT